MRKMERSNANQHQSLSASIKRGARSDATRGLLRSLPAFRADDAMPAQFAALLQELDRAEARQTRGQ